MKKRGKSILLLGLLLLILPGCSGKTPPGFEDFQELLEEKGFLVQIYEMDGGTGQGLEVDEEDCNLLFVSYETTEKAKKDYAASLETLDKIKKDAVVATSTRINGPNWGDSTVLAKGSYHRTSYIDHTMVVVKVSEERKKEMNDLLKEVGF